MKHIKTYDYAKTNFKNIQKQIADIGLAKYKQGLAKAEAEQEQEQEDDDDNDVSVTDPTTNKNKY